MLPLCLPHRPLPRRSTRRTARRGAAALGLLLVATATPALAASPDPGAALTRAAQVNDRDPSDLAALLRDDDTAELGDTGRLRYVEAAPTAKEAAALDRAAASEQASADQSASQAATAYPLDQTFALHSLPGSKHTILLDFDGSVVSGTQWNTQDGVASGAHPAWSLDADATTFSETERTAIQSIWARVAEDYAPFDVDVTTQDPGIAALDRSSAADEFFGVRVLISPSADAMNRICGGSCGGSAWVDVFDHYAGEGGDSASHETYQPAWVFPQALSNGTKAIAEAASHEAGHTFGLEHDGQGATAYYAGAGGWAPIMGQGYRQPITQWSRGEYTNATRSGQDDVAMIAGHGAPYRADLAGSTIATAGARLPVDPAVIGTSTDTDVYALGRCTGTVTVTATPAATSPDLDISLSLLNATGAVVATNDPASATSSADVATGMGASLTSALTPGIWYVSIDGVGRGTADNGYTDYASIGAYTMARSGSCLYDSPTVPSPPRTLGATLRSSGTEADAVWTAPASDGGSPLTGYDVTVNGAPLGAVGPSVTSVPLSGLTAGASYVVATRARNIVGVGPWSQVTLNVPGSGVASPSTPAPVAAPIASPPPVRIVPRAPGIRRAVAGRAGGRVTATARWSKPRADGGATADGYRVLAQRLDARGKVIGSVTRRVSGARSTSLVVRLAAGRWRFTVKAHSSVGWSKPSLTSAPVLAR